MSKYCMIEIAFNNKEDYIMRVKEYRVQKQEKVLK